MAAPTWYVVADGRREEVEAGYVVVDGRREQLDTAYVVVDGRRERFIVTQGIKRFSDTLSADEARSVFDRENKSRDEGATLSDAFGRQAIPPGLKQFADTLSVAETRATRDFERKSRSESAALSDVFNKDGREPAVKKVSDTLSVGEGRMAKDLKRFSRSEGASLSETWGRTRESEGPADLSVSYSAADCANNLSWTADGVNSQDIYKCTNSSTCSPGTKIADVTAGTSTYSDSVAGTTVGTHANYEIRSTAGNSNVAGAEKTVECAT